MMNSITRAITAALLLSLSGFAWSGAESGFYLGASIGSTDQDVDTDELSYDDDATGKKIFAGYNFGLLPLLDLAVEGAVVDFGEITSGAAGGQSSAQVDGLSGFGLVGIKLGLVGLFAKTGIINWDSETRVLGTNLDTSGNDAMYGVGVRLQFASLAIRAEYEVVETDNVDIDLYTAGLSWTF